MTRPIGLSILSAYLAIWVPLNFAVELGNALPSLGFRGVPAIVELAAHGAAAALALAAGWAIWTGNPDSVRLASAAVVVATVVAIQSLFWTSLARQTAPGQHLPLAAANLVNCAIWLLYLRRRARLFR